MPIYLVTINKCWFANSRYRPYCSIHVWFTSCAHWLSKANYL